MKHPRIPVTGTAGKIGRYVASHLRHVARAAGASPAQPQLALSAEGGQA